MQMGIGIGIPYDYLKGPGRNFAPEVPLPDLYLDLTRPNTALQLTTIRANYGWADDSAGNWSAFPPSIPRITDKGLLVEEQRINSIRNNSMQGAVAGSPGTLPTNWLDAGLGTLTKTIVGVGVENGVDYVDIRLAGVTSTVGYGLYFEALTGIVAAPAQAWSASVFFKLISGSYTNITGTFSHIRENDAGGAALVSNLSGFVADETLTRKLHTYTLVNAGVLRVVHGLSVSFASGVAIDITLRIGWPQLELGAFPTSPIRTTSAAVQRNVDQVSLASFGSLGYNVAAGTLFTEFTKPIATAASFNVATLFQAANTDWIRIWRWSGGLANLAAVVQVGNVNQVSIGYGGYTDGSVSPYKAAFAFAANDFAFTHSGAIPLTDTAGSLPIPTALWLGSNAVDNSQYLNGYIRRVAYWASRLTNAQLQLITA